MKVIFLDIDGVLNSHSYFINNRKKVKDFLKKIKNDKSTINLLLERQMMDIDYDKLAILKDIVLETGAKVVITSSWKKLKIYPYLEEKLISLGVPVIGVTEDNGDDRGNGIKEYLLSHAISEYVVIDDDIFKDYDKKIIDNLVKTNFFDGGLKEEHREAIIKKLKK